MKQYKVKLYLANNTEICIQRVLDKLKIYEYAPDTVIVSSGRMISLENSSSCNIAMIEFITLSSSDVYCDLSSLFRNEPYVKSFVVSRGVYDTDKYYGGEKLIDALNRLKGDSNVFNV